MERQGDVFIVTIYGSERKTHKTLHLNSTKTYNKTPTLQGQIQRNSMTKT